ncbi:hypothetical protein SDC9_132297 [bioreactor metagenome]|uniref:Flagellar motor switch protein FliN-like C-terminal domain-containing protein n=1 Tax=bioreactor metagenome TaxID=1076179 RepID=A0A645D7L9_9ZZZZ
MMGTEEKPTPTPVETVAPVNNNVHNSVQQTASTAHVATESYTNSNMGYNSEVAYTHKGPEVYQEQVQVKQAAFQPLSEVAVNNVPKNIDLILDVPLEVSVELGRTKKNIRDILALSAGSLIELNKLAEEPVDIYINGKKIAYGEVVVIDENFGVKITGIVSGEERIRTLSK